MEIYWNGQEQVGYVTVNGISTKVSKQDYAEYSEMLDQLDGQKQQVSDLQDKIRVSEMLIEAFLYQLAGQKYTMDMCVLKKLL